MIDFQLSNTSRLHALLDFLGIAFCIMRRRPFHDSPPHDLAQALMAG